MSQDLEVIHLEAREVFWGDDNLSADAYDVSDQGIGATVSVILVGIAACCILEVSHQVVECRIDLPFKCERIWTETIERGKLQRVRDSLDGRGVRGGKRGRGQHDWRQWKHAPYYIMCRCLFIVQYPTG